MLSKLGFFPFNVFSSFSAALQPAALSRPPRRKHDARMPPDTKALPTQHGGRKALSKPGKKRYGECVTHDGPPHTTTNRPLAASPTPGDRKLNNIFLAAAGNGLGNQTRGAAEVAVPGAPAMPRAAGSPWLPVPAQQQENVHSPGRLQMSQGRNFSTKNWVAPFS